MDQLPEQPFEDFLYFGQHHVRMVRKDRIIGLDVEQNDIVLLLDNGDRLSFWVYSEFRPQVMEEIISYLGWK